MTKVDEAELRAPARAEGWGDVLRGDGHRLVVIQAECHRRDRGQGCDISDL